MGIASAVEKGSYVYLYDDRGRLLTSIPAGTRPGDGLQGYTSRSVSVRRGTYVYVHDEQTRQISAIPASR